MAVERRHILFALGRTWWAFAIAVIWPALMVSQRGGTIIDYAWGVGVGIVLALIYFGYRLRRTQLPLPISKNVDRGDVVAGGSSEPGDAD